MTVDAPGSVFLAEIREQPDALRRLLEHRDEYEEVAREAVAREPHVVRLVGHGSSDNAASYGVYAFGLEPAWTALRDSISLSVYYGADFDLRRSIVLGDTARFLAIPGVGKKTAERVVLELKEKLGLEQVVPEGAPDLVARDALLELGYSAVEAERALATTDPEAPPEERVRQALKAA